MKIVFMIISGLAITVAGVFIWLGDFTTAFVIAAIGLVAWFLNYRMQVKEVLLAAEAERKNEEPEEPDEN